VSEQLTGLKRARGLGSAKTGVSHFIGQRVSAVALLLLAPWLIWSGGRLAGHDYADARAWVANPINASLLILTVLAGFYHGRIGMAVVIEDYIHRPLTRTVLLILNTFVAAAGATIATVAILGVLFGGTGAAG
jgi:succinate dehydrogenase / fumarate reductase membrane anchor subunit